MNAPIDVIIPCYNYGHFLGLMIESVLAQTLAPQRIVVVDDGSTDDTKAVCARYEGVEYLWKPNGGPSSARNFGLARTTGEHVLFPDADDLLVPEALEMLWRARRRVGPDAGAVFAHTEPFRERPGDGGEGGRRFPAPEDVDPYVLRWIDADTAVLSRAILRRLLRNNILMPSCTLLPRRALDEFGGFDEAIISAEDQDLFLRIAARRPLAYVNRTASYYRKHPAGLTDPSHWIRNRRNILYVLNKASRARWAGPRLRLMARRQYAGTADYLAQRYADRKAFADALATYGDALRHDPFRPRTWARLAICCCQALAAGCGGP